MLDFVREFKKKEKQRLNGTLFKKKLTDLNYKQNTCVCMCARFLESNELFMDKKAFRISTVMSKWLSHAHLLPLVRGGGW